MSGEVQASGNTNLKKQDLSQLVCSNWSISMNFFPTDHANTRPMPTCFFLSLVSYCTGQFHQNYIALRAPFDAQATPIRN